MTARDPALSLQLRPLVRTTRLGAPGASPAIILPAGDPAYAALAAKLAVALAARGVVAECIPDLALMPERSTPLPPAFRTRPLFVLGNLTNNRALQPHYANFLCATDATYPGASGWELRTLVDPYAKGANLILAGGSNLSGVTRAVERLLAVINTAPAAVELPWLFELELDPALAAGFAAWPHTPLDEASLKITTNRGYFFIAEVIRVISTYTHMWWLTGDGRYAAFAVENLRALNGHAADSYGDWHYMAERFLRALPLLAGGGWLTPAELARTYDLLLGTALASQDDWWRMRDGGPPLGHRHQGKGTLEFLLLARCLRDTVDPAPAVRALCDRWIGECHAFLDSLCRAGIDDQDDESTFNNLAQLYRYALGEERHEFFTAGHARRGAERALALHDNLGSGAGQGGYGEGLSMHYQQEAAAQVACSAFYYHDGRLKWILHHLPRLAQAQRLMPFQFTPTFVHNFATGPDLPAVPPRELCGLSVLPATAHQLTLSTRPPLHVEFRGHLANAPETWQLPEGIGLTQLSADQAFDKLVLRGGFAPADPYLLLQGWQGGFRWQGHMQAANCIVRFGQAGHIWLVQNTVRHSPYDKNGLLISDGANLRPVPPLAECVAGADFAPAALSVTRLPDCQESDWTRHIFWAKAGAGWFVVLDRVNFKSGSVHSLTCTWRTSAYAALDGRRWRSDQGTHRFELVAGDHVPATCEEESNQGASRPFVLRQRLTGPHRAGDVATFQNLFYVRPQAAAESLDLQRLDECSALVFRNGTPIAWCGADLTGATAWWPGASTVAGSAWLTPGALVLAGATALSLPGLALHSATPVAVLLDFTMRLLTLQSGSAASVTITLGSTAHTLSGGQTLPLPAELCPVWSAAINAWLSALHPALTPPAPANFAPVDPRWRTAWTFTGGTLVPERIRNVCITAHPRPTDGIPDQLIDTLLPQSREIVEQWPAAPHYDLTLTFPGPQAVETVNLLGDCVEEPTLRVFSPLPENLRLEAETADGQRHACQVQPAPDRLYKRVYVDFAYSLLQRRAAINLPVRALHLHLPAPPDSRPLVLHEVEVLGPRRTLAAVKHWLAADLNGDGATAVVYVDTAGTLRVLDVQGRLRWEQSLGLEATHLSVQPAGPGGTPAVCVGLIDGTLHLFAASGTRLRLCPLLTQFREVKDRLMGFFCSVNSLAVWHRDESGRGWLVAGGYGMLLFLDGDGRILGHSWADGAWINHILVLPPGHPAAGDLYIRSGWNHGIGHYAGLPGSAPSGVIKSWGGFPQPMFRELKRVIPFINGPPLMFAFTAAPGQAAGTIIAAAELGCGLFSLQTRDWHWKHEIVGRLQAACLGRVAGEPAVLVGGADGFVTAFALADGRLLRTHLAAAPVVGLNATASGELLVATRLGVQVLDAGWQPRPSIACPLRRALPLGDRGFLLTREDHTLELHALSS